VVVGISLNTVSSTWLFKEKTAMNARTFPFFNNLKTASLAFALMAFIAMTLGVTTNAHAQTTTTSTCGGTCVTPAPTPVYGVTTWTIGQSAAAGQGMFKVIGTGDSAGSGAAGNTNELFNVQTLISFKADQACGPQCGDQVVQFKVDGLQQALGASAAVMKGGTEGQAIGQSGTAFQSMVSAGGKFVPITTGPVTTTTP
jgi:hypothetical protein